MERIREFFISGSDVWCQTENGVECLDESNAGLVDYLFESIKRFYPLAFKALSECYSKSQMNLPYFKFLCARRFSKCNFGSLDTTREDVDVSGRFHFEKVICPLRGECKYEGCICMPKFDSCLSEAELRVMKLFYRGKNANEIAEELNTAKEIE